MEHGLLQKFETIHALTIFDDEANANGPAAKIAFQDSSRMLASITIPNPVAHLTFIAFLGRSKQSCIEAALSVPTKSFVSFLVEPVSIHEVVRLEITSSGEPDFPIQSVGTEAVSRGSRSFDIGRLLLHVSSFTTLEFNLFSEESTKDSIFTVLFGSKYFDRSVFTLNAEVFRQCGRKASENQRNQNHGDLDGVTSSIHFDDPFFFWLLAIIFFPTNECIYNCIPHKIS
ncbi:MAG: hypothetical protein IKI57_06455 [Clostridia bacterium]|nr:hypothetical protein [Clostridia bacterium]